MTWQPYLADDYIDFPSLLAWCRELAEEHPRWVRYEQVGLSRHGRPLILLTIGDSKLDAKNTPAVWIDAGTHASEWTSVSASLYTVSKWLEGLTQTQDAEMISWFESHVALVMPCVSPDGYEAMHQGHPFVRSSLRPPIHPVPRQGLVPKDMNGDGKIMWMRWPHPSGPYVQDETSPMMMRARRLGDAPEDAFFVCSEGEFLHWDGVTWTQAKSEFGVDLNRNFPGGWKPSSMFGMDAGQFALSEEESRALMDTFTQAKYVQCALTLHTYTGGILTQPYRQDTQLGKVDIRVMESLAEQLVEGTDYKVYRVCPDFMYDPKEAIGGVWADTVTTTLGIPAYTVEFWNPYGWAGVAVEKPAEFFMKPDEEILRAILTKCVEEGAYTDWHKVSHPQLGEVEVGGIEYLKTVRNPPTALLSQECEKGWVMSERMRQVGAKVNATAKVSDLGQGRFAVELMLENQGFLSTSGLNHAQAHGMAPGCMASVHGGDEMDVEFGGQEVALEHLDGWGQNAAIRGHVIYPQLPQKGGPRAHVRWVVTGVKDQVTIKWQAGRAGGGELEVKLAPS